MREHEHVAVVGGVVAPPAFPCVVGPGTANGTEHVAAHDPGAEVVEAAVSEIVVGAGGAAVLAGHPRVVSAIAERLSAQARAATGSASRVVAALLMGEPLRFDRGEVTDKGSVNQRAVLRERANLVAALYAGGAGVIEADWKGAKA